MTCTDALVFTDSSTHDNADRDISSSISSIKTPPLILSTTASGHLRMARAICHSRGEHYDPLLWRSPHLLTLSSVTQKAAILRPLVPTAFLSSNSTERGSRLLAQGSHGTAPTKSLWTVSCSRRKAASRATELSITLSSKANLIRNLTL